MMLFSHPRATPPQLLLYCSARNSWALAFAALGELCKRAVMGLESHHTACFLAGKRDKPESSFLQT